MHREAPDTHFYAEIHDFNLEFLSLVMEAGQRSRGGVLGLDPAVVHQIGRMSSAELAEMAATPCLLAGFAGGRPGRPAATVAEPTPARDPEWAEHARLFAAGLLTYARQMARRDSLRAALCAGPAAARLAGDSTFRDIRGHADRALQHLEARFRCHARFWPDLVAAARAGQPERLHLARLTAIQLATSELRRARTARSAGAVVMTGSAGTG